MVGYAAKSGKRAILPRRNRNDADDRNHSARRQARPSTENENAQREAEGVIQWQGDGFPLDQSRVGYLRYLRRERRQSPRSEADAEHAKAKAALLRLRIAEKQRELVRREAVDELIDAICGIVLTHLSGMAARCAGPDLALRRKIDRVVFDVRADMAKACSEAADERGEP